MKTFFLSCGSRPVSAVAIILLSATWGNAEIFTVGTGGDYSTVKEAINVARTTPGDHTIRIIDSREYKEYLDIKDSFKDKNILLEAASGQTPRIPAIKLDGEIGSDSWTLKGLTFVSDLGKEADQNAALSIRDIGTTGAQIVITNCVFLQNNNDDKKVGFTVFTSSRTTPLPD